MYVHEYGNEAGSREAGKEGRRGILEGHEEFREVDVGEMDDRVSPERTREIHGELMFAA